MIEILDDWKNFLTNKNKPEVGSYIILEEYGEYTKETKYILRQWYSFIYFWRISMPIRTSSGTYVRFDTIEEAKEYIHKEKTENQKKTYKVIEGD